MGNNKNNSIDNTTIRQPLDIETKTLSASAPQLANTELPLNITPAGNNTCSDDNTTIIKGPTPTYLPSNASTPSLGEGSLINNRFILEKVLGFGGMGVVYRALDKRKQEANDENPYIAIKILGDDFKLYPQAFVSLQRETKKSQSLAHPNIITVYDFDRDGDEVYMTMEELHGHNLADYIKAHPFGVPIEKAKKIIHAISKGLIYTHSKQIIHSDLKPANIFITSDETVKILDFGIAKVANDIKGAKASNNDEDEISALTPSYASNEMLEGQQPLIIDDLYALGLICYQLLSGEHPFQLQPANKALQKKLKPKRIKKLKKYQWQALEKILALKQQDRTAEVQQFLHAFEGINRARNALIFTFTLITVIFINVIIFRPENKGPDVPFAQLSAKLQSKISLTLTSGTEALTFNDLNAALFYFNKAYELHPKNLDAQQGLEKVVEQIVSNIENIPVADLTIHQLNQINTLLKYNSLTENKQLTNMKIYLNKNLSH